MRIWGWRMIRLALGLTLLPALAQADAWEAFVTRCLVPMEATVALDVSDFTFDQASDVGDVYILETETYQVRALVGDQSGIWTPQACQVSAYTEDSRADLFTGFAAWEKAAIASGRYEPADSDPALFDQTWPTGLLSVGFREPRIQVDMNADWSKTPTFVAIQETDLES